MPVRVSREEAASPDVKRDYTDPLYTDELLSSVDKEKQREAFINACRYLEIIRQWDAHQP